MNKIPSPSRHELEAFTADIVSRIDVELLAANVGFKEYELYQSNDQILKFKTLVSKSAAVMLRLMIEDAYKPKNLQSRFKVVDNEQE